MDFLEGIFDVATGVGGMLAVGAVAGAIGGYVVNPVGHVKKPPRVNVNNAMAQAGSAHGATPYKVLRPYTQGRVKALFIGINYHGTRSELSGCVNDVRTMLSTLNKIEFPIQESVILVDDQRFPGFTAMPTRDNIIKYMAWLVKDARPGDVLFFHFSGHGAQAPSMDDDEEDGLDECLCPLDYNTAGTIVDDDIFELMVRRLPAGVHMTALFDCCHSGTIMDLPFEFVGKSGLTLNSNLQMRRAKNKNFSAADVVMFSGCADSQTSADVSNTHQFGTGSAGAGGAATQALTWALTNTRGLSYAEMILKMRDVLAQKRFHQVPQLSSTKPVDLKRPFSMFGALEMQQQMVHYVPQQFQGGGGFAPPLGGGGPHPQGPPPPHHHHQQFHQPPPPQQRYPSPQGGYPPQQGGYPPQQGGYPPQQGGYPPQQGGYPPQQGGYPPQQGGYPPQQGGYQGPHSMPAYPAQAQPAYPGPGYQGHQPPAQYPRYS